MVLTCVSLLYQMISLKCLKPYSKLKMDYLIQAAGLHFICCHVHHYTCESNTENVCVKKFLELKTKIKISTCIIVYKLTS